MFIKPYVSASVLYHPFGHMETHIVQAAIIVDVWNDSFVNIVTWTRDAMQNMHRGVSLIQGATELPSGEYVSWPNTPPTAGPYRDQSADERL